MPDIAHIRTSTESDPTPDNPSYFDDEDGDEPISRASCLLILVFAALAWGALGVIAAIVWRILR